MSVCFGERQLPRDLLCGGIIGVAVAFALPTLFFLDPLFFGLLIKDSATFVLLCSGLALVAGLFGCSLAFYWAESLLAKKHIPFPVGVMTARVLGASSHRSHLQKIVTGALAAFAPYRRDALCDGPCVFVGDAIAAFMVVGMHCGFIFVCSFSSGWSDAR